MRGHREQLLATTPDDLPSGYADALEAFCRDTGSVARGYVCAVEVTREAGPERQLRFSVKLSQTVAEPADAHDVLLSLLSKLGESHLPLMTELGIGVLADRAVDAWEAKAVRVYPR